ncbi:hypothetical protein D9M72_582200 [compost metagenome]
MAARSWSLRCTVLLWNTGNISLNMVPWALMPCLRKVLRSWWFQPRAARSSASRLGAR